MRHGASLSYAPVRRSCETAPELLALGPSYGLYSILDFIVDNYMPIVRDFREELQELEQDVFAETYKRTTIKRLYDMQRELMNLRLAVAPLQDVTNQLVRLHPNLIHEETRVYFRDVYDHVFRVNEATNAMREMLGAAINVNMSLVTPGPERGDEEAGRLGRHAGHADPGHQLVRHELPPHAGAGQALGLPGHDRADRLADGRRVLGPQAFALALTRRKAHARPRQRKADYVLQQRDRHPCESRDPAPSCHTSAEMTRPHSACFACARSAMVSATLSRR